MFFWTFDNQIDPLLKPKSYPRKLTLNFGNHFLVNKNEGFLYVQGIKINCAKKVVL